MQKVIPPDNTQWWAEKWLQTATMEFDEEDQIHTLRVKDKLVVHGEGPTQAEARADLLAVLKSIAASRRFKMLPMPSTFD